MLLGTFIRILTSLIRDFCTSDRNFASTFFQIPPHDGHPWSWLVVGHCDYNPHNRLSLSRYMPCPAYLNNQEHCCFLILDVDAFKSVNDNYGHAVGDKVLENLGLLFKNHFRQSDIVGRIGGDEFIILIQDENIAESRIQSLLQKVNELKIEELKDFKLSISIGIAFAPKDGTTFMELYRHADQALYQTKRTGKNNYKIYKNDKN